MAAMIASRRSSKLLLEKLLSPVRCIASSSPSSSSSLVARSFNTSAQSSDLDEDRSLDVDRRGADQSPAARRRGADPFSGFFSDVFDPFYPPSRSISQLLNMMNQFMDAPLAAATSKGLGMGGGPRRGWDLREDDDALYLRIDMPGLGKEDVKMSVEQGTLVIRGGEAPSSGGERENEEEEDGGASGGRRYSSRLDLPPEVYKLDQIRAEMKNGMLKVLVPKVKKAERKDVVQIQVD